MTTQDNIFPIIIILGVIAFFYFARNIYWWSIPNKIVMKSHLRNKMSKRVRDEVSRSNKS
ncbi:hypothetical protein [Lactococcus lactis]|uniref:hypothetical protein n=1 Tax=Lactococcus lactis TaxID=1358 RepID=UPI001012DA52|nr:hypothetical protein [Lactococcus lactis]RXS50356.1 hypothetical protein ES032_12320 [Lactococcus lactis]